MNTLFWRPTLTLTIGSLLLFLTACEKGTVTEELQAETQAELSEETLNKMPYVEAELLLDPVLQEATETEELAILIDGAPEELPEGRFIFLDSTGQRHTIWNCLDSIQLTQAQKDSIKGATKRFILCKRFTIHEIRQINRTIISGANLERKALIKRYQNGNLTRAALQRELRKLTIQTRIELRNNPVKRRHLAQLRHCYHRYLRALHGTLTPAQWATFKDCFSSIRPR